MHSRKEIIENQTKFREEIVKFLKVEFNQIRKEVNGIKSKDPEIVAGKKSMLEKSKKVQINEEINKMFLSWKNIRPNFYAWWDEEYQQVVKLKYID